MRFLSVVPGYDSKVPRVDSEPRIGLGLDILCMRDILQRMLNYVSKEQPATSCPTNIKRLASFLKVLSEPNRLLILNLLMQGVQCNCEIGELLQMAPNLISHHIRMLRKAGLVDVERDALDSRWVYYSINTQVLNELNQAFNIFFDPDRIQPRSPTCGPQFISISNL